MRKLLFILLLSGCVAKKVTSNLRIVTLDGSGTIITGGDGTVFIDKWQWSQLSGTPSVIGNPNSVIAETIVPVGEYTWRLKVTDNLGDTASLIYSKNVQ